MKLAVWKVLLEVYSQRLLLHVGAVVRDDNYANGRRKYMKVLSAALLHTDNIQFRQYLAAGILDGDGHWDGSRYNLKAKHMPLIRQYKNKNKNRIRIT